MQTGAVEADSPNVGLRIIATTKNAACRLVGTIDMCYSSQEALRAPAIVVAPEAIGERAHLAQFRTSFRGAAAR